jgi:hypothetical protein
MLQKSQEFQFMEAFGEISQNITIDLIYTAEVSVMVLLEAKTARYNLFSSAQCS